MAQILTNFLLALLIVAVIFAAALLQQGMKDQQQQLEAIAAQLEAMPAPAQAPKQANATSPEQSDTTPPTDPVEVAVDVHPMPVRKPASEPQPDVTPEPLEHREPDEQPAAPIQATPEPVFEPEIDVDPPVAVVEDDPVWQANGAIVQQIIEDLLAGRYKQVEQRFNGDMRGQADADLLATVMDPLRAQHGGFKSILSHRLSDVPTPSDINAFVVITETQRGSPLKFTITIDAASRIAGLFVQPHQR